MTSASTSGNARMMQRRMMDAVLAYSRSAIRTMRRATATSRLVETFENFIAGRKPDCAASVKQNIEKSHRMCYTYP